MDDMKEMETELKVELLTYLIDLREQVSDPLKINGEILDLTDDLIMDILKDLKKS